MKYETSLRRNARRKEKCKRMSYTNNIFENPQIPNSFLIEKFFLNCEAHISIAEFKKGI